MLAADAGEVATIAALAIAPIAIVVIVALLRGYDVTVYFRRGRDRD